MAWLLVVVVPLQGQDRPESPDGKPGVESEEGQVPAPDAAPPGAHGWLGFRGAPEPNRIYLGVWALHLQRMGDGLSAHHLLGGTWRGFYVATFVNTHEGRTWSAGVGRLMLALEGPAGGFAMGYRAGLVTGYDHRLMDIAERWPVIPAAQITADVSFRRVGIQAGWSWVVTTFGGFIEF